MWVVFFPTSLCGVLVFDSVSRAPPARLLLPPPPSHNNLTHTQTHTQTHTHNTLTLTHRHTHNTLTLTHTNNTLTHTHKQTTHSHTHKQHTHTHTNTHILRGKRGTNSHLPSFHVAGVVQPHIYRRFVWQACHLWHWVARLDLVRRPWRRGILRGRRGTTSHLPSFHVAGVAQPHIYRRFAWQAWHLWHWVARLDLVRRPWRRGILRGRRGTTSHLPSFHVAGVAQPHIYRRFAWQAWHLWHWVARLDLVRRPWRRGIVRGRRGTNSHLPSFCVAGVALMALGGALGLG